MEIDDANKVTTRHYRLPLSALQGSGICDASRRHNVLGTGVDRVTMTEALEVVRGCIEADRQMSIYAVNPEKVVRAQSDDQLRKLLGGGELLIPDGIGVVLALRLRGLDAQRVPGSELMPALCAAAAAADWPVYLLGASEEVNRAAADRLKRRYPGLRIAGRRNGYFDASELLELRNEINRSGARILFAALGSPKQEEWIEENRTFLGVNVFQGVGGTFDVIAGRVRRAPAVWRYLNLEWLYRLLSQPRRLLRQRALPVFALQVLRERLPATTARK